jgi:hypothetical protein
MSKSTVHKEIKLAEEKMKELITWNCGQNTFLNCFNGRGLKWTGKIKT